MVGQASDCLFCGIVTGEVNADVLHASDNVIAFRDLKPQAPTHILVIPKEHVESAASLGESHAALLGEVFSVAAHLAKAEGIHARGWRLVTNVGSEAGQSVFHLHFHLLGGRRMRWPPG